jgi:DNA-directed RNA polymerase specialized sigma24 family protein
MSKYITNKEILETIDKWDRTGPMPEELGEAFLIIAKNLSNKSNFIGYTWKDEMIAEAVFTCVKYFRNFDPDKSSNPFAYITRICYHSFVNSIKKNNKHGQIKQELYDSKDRVDHHSFFTYNSIDYTELLGKEEENENIGS